MAAKMCRWLDGVPWGEVDSAEQYEPANIVQEARVESLRERRVREPSQRTAARPSCLNAVSSVSARVINHPMTRSGERQTNQSVPVARQVLLQCAESCERALTEYTTEVGMVAGHELFRELLRAIATIQTAVDLLDEDDSRRELALRLTAEACGAAAVRCRRAGLDGSLLRCAAACGRAADEAELLLTSLGH